MRRKLSGSFFFKPSAKNDLKMDHNEMFGDLFKAFVKAYPEKKKSACQAEAILFWNQLKTSEPKDKLPELVRSKIQQLEALALGRQGALMKFWGKAASAASPTPAVSQSRASPSEHGASGSGQSSRKGEAKIAQPSSASCLKRPAPVQQKISEELNEVTAQVLRMKERESAGLMTEGEFKQLKLLTGQRNKLEKELKAKISQQERQKKRRVVEKSAKERLLEEIPEAGKLKKTRFLHL